MLGGNMVETTNMPDAQGHFGPYGGRYVPETLVHPLQELETHYFQAQQDPAYLKELDYYLREFCGRPTPLYFAERLTTQLGGAKIYLKREDLLHTGAHKINNAMGQILLARRMGKTRVIAETGAGQHGVATATVSAMFGLKCVVYMGAVDCARQALNVRRIYRQAHRTPLRRTAPNDRPAGTPPLNHRPICPNIGAPAHHADSATRSCRPTSGCTMGPDTGARWDAASHAGRRRAGRARRCCNEATPASPDAAA